LTKSLKRGIVVPYCRMGIIYIFREKHIIPFVINELLETVPVQYFYRRTLHKFFISLSLNFI